MANFLYRPDSKYFSLCGLTMASVAHSSLFLFCLVRGPVLARLDCSLYCHALEEKPGHFLPTVMSFGFTGGQGAWIITLGEGGARSWERGGAGSAPWSNFCLPLCIAKRTQLNVRHKPLNSLLSQGADIQSFRMKCPCRATFSKH